MAAQLGQPLLFGILLNQIIKSILHKQNPDG